MPQTSLRLRITGRVQGVAFRAWTRGRATALGLTGWVRNEPWGSVEVHLEGPDEAVQRMLTDCWSGPAAADVRDVQAEPAPHEGGTGFEIRA